jgi:hypothetical protein
MAAPKILSGDSSSQCAGLGNQAVEHLIICGSFPALDCVAGYVDYMVLVFIHL